MPVVTDIKKQKRSDTRYSVYLEGEYVFALSDLDLSTSGLRVGQELTDAQVAEYIESASEAKAYALALRFLGLRPRSVREMRDYLRRKDITPGDVESATERLLRAKLLDDLEFARSWIRTRQSLRPRSSRMLQQELAAKGVSRDVVAEAIGELDGDAQLDTLVEVMQRKRRLPQYATAEKLLGYFARQGYPYDQLKKALERLD
jgi:regulatory protein